MLIRNFGIVGGLFIVEQRGIDTEDSRLLTLINIGHPMNILI